MDVAPGDLVLVSARAHPPADIVRKLRPRYYGPYPVKAKVHDNAYKLEGLPSAMPSTINVEFLRLFQPTPTCFAFRPNRTVATPVFVGDHLEWEVEAIVAYRPRGSG